MEGNNDHLEQKRGLVKKRINPRQIKKKELPKKKGAFFIPKTVKLD